MKLRILPAISALAITAMIPPSAMADGALTTLHPEATYPDNLREVSPGPYTERVKSVQRKLHASGFDAGPVNGEIDAKSQAALAQFQLSRQLPASGMLDAATLAELEVN